jgi:hypothetical protein
VQTAKNSESRDPTANPPAAPTFGESERRQLGLLGLILAAIAAVEVSRATGRTMALVAVGLNVVTFASCVGALYALRRTRSCRTETCAAPGRN